MRDSQKSKVYRSEWGTIDANRGNLTLEECQELVDKVLASKYIQKKYPNAVSLQNKINVVSGRRGGHAGYRLDFGGKFISLGLWARQKPVVLHEVAHHLAGVGRGHDWKYCSIMLDLVRHFMSKEDHDNLKSAYRSNKVRFTAPRQKRQLTPEQRAELVERMARARAVKESKKLAETGQ